MMIMTNPRVKSMALMRFMMIFQVPGVAKPIRHSKYNRIFRVILMVLFFPYKNNQVAGRRAA
jgi:hypothetical protein